MHFLHFLPFFSWYSTGDDAHISCFFSCKTSSCHKRSALLPDQRVWSKDGASHIGASPMKERQRTFCISRNGKVGAWRLIPPPAQAPSIQATTGFFNLTDVKDQVVEISHIGLSLGRCRDTSCIAVYTFFMEVMSPPAQNFPPSPRRTITRMLGSKRNCSRTSESSAAIGWLKAFNF